MDDCYVEYWVEAVESSLEAVGVVATQEQVKQIAVDMRNSQD